MSKEDTLRTIKSIRRKVEKGYTKTRPHAKVALDNGNYALYGTYMHRSIFHRVKLANIDGLVIDKTILKTPESMGVSGEMRRPDFQWKPGTDEYDIWDLKPDGYDWINSQQYRDIVQWTGIEPTKLTYHR